MGKLPCRVERRDFNNRVEDDYYKFYLHQVGATDQFQVTELSFLNQFNHILFVLLHQEKSLDSCRLVVIYVEGSLKKVVK